ncbi:hypothetical protein ZWY2020_022751 [Hordeum vulgare]|nr:hypothetical protein ZWY2020_022751 [Hordeum vulgare]
MLQLARRCKTAPPSGPGGLAGPRRLAPWSGSARCGAVPRLASPTTSSPRRPASSSHSTPRLTPTWPLAMHDAATRRVPTTSSSTAQGLRCSIKTGAASRERPAGEVEGGDGEVLADVDAAQVDELLACFKRWGLAAFLIFCSHSGLTLDLSLIWSQVGIPFFRG